MKMAITSSMVQRARFCAVVAQAHFCAFWRLNPFLSCRRNKRQLSFLTASRYYFDMHIFRNARPTDAPRCYEIETAAYEGDEAATFEKIANRIETYPDGFLILEVGGKVVGFINCGCAYNVEMSDEAFKELIGHDPDAPNAVILSVVVDPSHQGKGHSTEMIQEFIKRMKHMGKAAIFLMCKAHHVPLYEKFGFGYDQPSASDHGGMAWHEMSMTL